MRGAPTERMTWKRLLLVSLAWPAAGIAWIAFWTARRHRAGAGTAFAGLALMAGAGLPGARGDAWELARTGLLAPITAPALAWGVAHGGEIHFEGGMLMVTGMEGGHGTRSTITVGQVVLTSRDRLNTLLLEHESRHGDQWAVLGWLTPPLYYLSDVVQGGPEHNVFEVSAGLSDGGYEV